MAEETSTYSYTPRARQPEPDNESSDKEDYKEYTSDKDLSEIEQQKLVLKLDQMFTYALEHPSWRAGREKMVECHKYREGEQWTDEELRDLEDRHQPPTVNNQISVVVNKLVGDLLNQRFRIGFRGRNELVDKEVADALTDIFMYVRQSNDLEFEERDMADEGFTSGMGALEAYVTFDDLYQPEIKIRVEDELIIFPDPDSRRYDWNEDARFVCRAKWWNVDEAAEMYPQAELKINGVMSDTLSASGIGSQLATVDLFKGETYVDPDNHRIRIIEVQYKKKIREELVIFENGQSALKEEAKDLIKQADEQKISYRIIPRLSHKICVGIYAAGILLEHRVTDYKYFSLIPYFVFRRKNGAPYSLITLALSMQDAINKRESKALHLLNTNQAIFETSAVKDKDHLAEELAKPDGQIEISDGALANQRFQLQRNIELANSQFTMHLRSQDDLYRIVGIDPRTASQTGEIRSGAGLQRKFMEASKPVAALFDNIRRTRKIFGRVVLDLVQNYYTPEKVFLVTDDENKARLVNLTEDVLTKIKTRTYDVVVDEFEDTTTLQQEQYNLFIQALPQILPFGPYWVKKLLQMSQLRDKDKVIQELEQQSGPPPLEPRVSVQANINELTPEERAFFYERMGNSELAEVVRQMQPMTTSQERSSIELAKTTIKAKRDGENKARKEAAS